MKYAFYETPFGLIKIGYEEGKLTCVTRINKIDEENEPSDITERAYAQLTEYFEGTRKEFDLPLKLVGTEFQISVWNALLDIPYGETRSYKDIAIAIGNPKACRAVGMANHNNPLWIVVPCHRVIGTNKKLVGYAGGVDMKERLLAMESENI